MIWSFPYWAFRRLLELVALRFRSEQSKEAEIIVLRHQLQVLQTASGSAEAGLR